MPHSALDVGARHTPCRLKGVGGEAKEPLGPAELCLHGAQRLYLTIQPSIEVPPACPIRREIEGSVGRPFRLEDGLGLRACHELSIEWVTVCVDLPDPELCAVPGHVRVIPSKPGQAAAIRAQPGRGVEVVSRHQDLKSPSGAEVHGP